MKHRIKYFDGLRGVAILTVLVWHYLYVYGLRNSDFKYIPDFFNNVINLGQFGVTAFFLLSGNLIYGSLKNSSGKPNFLISRLARICVPYWSALFFIVMIMATLNNYQYSFEQIISNLFLVQDLLPYEHIDGVFWTLVIEVKFYILVGFLGIKFIKPRTKIAMFFFSAICILASISSYFFSVGLYFKLWSSFSLLFIGLHLGKVGKTDKSTFINVLVVSLSYLLLPSNQYGDKLGYSIAIFSAFILFLNKEKIKFLNNPVIGKFGVVSYSIYLYHQELGYAILDFSYGYINPTISIFLTLIVIFSISSISYILMERKSSMFFKNKLSLCFSK
ncbi:hypothetical protein CWN98_12535 [Vibrio splendidus]|uniref:acyltransferase family protein n=1 Tax=Vibrio splendidus TaxID=29497 RepID=UPI000D396940|nr:acyltransferase [Vibrio splendidus]PTO86892.1 hypothetical protein CWN98_12535 [Vibrio splendidus]PTP47531.1 hypothetical protein CWO10_12000 [Vibrio splendidus]